MRKLYWAIFGALILGATWVVFSGPHMTSAVADQRLGQVLLGPKQIAAVTSIKLNRDDKVLQLVKTAAGLWEIAPSPGATSAFAADAKRIASLLDSVAATKYVEVIATKKKNWEALGLTKATELVLKGGDTELLNLHLGNSRPGGGQYAAVGQEEMAFLLSSALATEFEAAAWELKSLIDIKPALVSQVSFHPAAALKKVDVELKREKAEEAFKVDPSKDEKENAGEIGNVASILSGVTFSARHALTSEDAAKAFLNTSSVAIHLFDGRQVAVTIGRFGDNPIRYFIKMAVTPAPGTKLDSDSERLGDLMTKNAFEVNPGLAARFEKGRADFMTPINEEKTEAKDTASGKQKTKSPSKAKKGS